jgi:hypothetical protein
MAAPKLSERRVSQRYVLSKETPCGHVVFDKSVVLPIEDISYGGFSVSTRTADHQSFWEKTPRMTEVEVVIFGVSTTGRALRIFESKQRLGFAFCHDTASMLIFLRRFIEFMRLGEHLNALDKSGLKPPFDSPDWLFFRGDGPTSILVHKSPQNSQMIDEAVISFREKDSYRSAEFKNGRFLTGVSSDTNSSFGKLSSTDQSLNEDILRKAACITMGYAHICSSEERPMIEHLMMIFRNQLLSSPVTAKH